jgi:hypothetical protein
MILVKQKPKRVLRRGDPAIVAWSYDWDVRHIATEMSLSLICDPFEFKAGQVIKLIGFGPASLGTTTKTLPGRWLVSEVKRDMGSFASELTLKQPQRAAKEPASELIQRPGEEDSDSSASTDSSGPIEGTPKHIIDTIVVPLAAKNGMVTGKTPEMVEQQNAGHSKMTSSNNLSDHAGPGGTRWAADMSNGQSPTKEMDALARDLAKRFDIPWSGSGAISATHNGIRYQMIYRSNVGGNHYNHVHFGCEVEGA